LVYRKVHALAPFFSSKISLKNSKILTYLNEAINDELMSLESWLKGNRILNIAKTHTLLICSKSKQRALINSNELLGIKVKD